MLEAIRSKTLGFMFNVVCPLYVAAPIYLRRGGGAAQPAATQSLTRLGLGLLRYKPTQ